MLIAESARRVNGQFLPPRRAGGGERLEGCTLAELSRCDTTNPRDRATDSPFLAAEAQAWTAIPDGWTLDAGLGTAEEAMSDTMQARPRTNRHALR
jgi:hypothetical protein